MRIYLTVLYFATLKLSLINMEIEKHRANNEIVFKISWCLWLWKRCDLVANVFVNICNSRYTNIFWIKDLTKTIFAAFGLHVYVYSHISVCLRINAARLCASLLTQATRTMYIVGTFKAFQEVVLLCYMNRLVVGASRVLFTVNHRLPFTLFVLILTRDT